MLVRDDVTEPNIRAFIEHPCAVCGVEGQWECWDVRFCIPCFDACQRELPFTTAGFECTADDFPRVATEKTRAWVAARKAATR